MIAVELIGCLEDDAKILRDADGKPCGIEFVVSVPKYDNTNPKHCRVTYTHVHCTRSGRCAADARFVRGQKIYVRGDVSVGTENELTSKIWQFELM